LALDFATTVIGWVTLHRQRIARLLLVAAVCFGATRVWPAFPQKTDLRIDLGPQHREIMELHVDVTKDGVHVQSSEFRFPKGAPPIFQHEMSLPTGRYDVQVRCQSEKGTTSVERALDLPSAEVVRLDARGGRV
jgi:hypothetical protein